jgi:hypothetical protein
MWLMGKIMFTDNHVNTISAQYITIAQKIAEATSQDDITPRSWGSTVLAVTYRVKGICPRGNNKVVIIIFHVYDKCLFLMLELY